MFGERHMHVHLHLERDPALQRIEDSLAALTRKVDQMAVDFAAILAQIDEVTTRLATDIETLIARLTAGGHTEAEEEQLAADLQARIDALKGVATTAENPIPADLPPPVV
jgi:ABC-type transporter Mla subunit MlaD